MDDGCRSDSRKSQPMWESGRLSAHSRSRSMDFLPQKDKLGTRALCALFESKATLQQSFNSSPRLNSFSEVDGKAMIDCPLQDKVSHNTTPKDTWIQVRFFLPFEAGTGVKNAKRKVFILTLSDQKKLFLPSYKITDKNLK